MSKYITAAIAITAAFIAGMGKMIFGRTRKYQNNHYAEVVQSDARPHYLKW